MYFQRINMNMYSLTATVLPPLHLLSFSALLGMEIYQTFVMTKIAFQALPRTAFTQLQGRIFPVYFACQSTLLCATALTVPPWGLFSIVEKKSAWIPLLFAGITAGLNIIEFGPKSKNLMVARVHQGKPRKTPSR